MKSNDGIFIGLTGCIGSGKSTATTFLRKLGYPVIDADQLAREVVMPGSEGLKEITECFGQDFLTQEGTLNRMKLGAYVFNHPEALSQLNAIVHPKVREALLEQFKVLSKTHAIIFADIPLLIESDLMVYFDAIWLVYAPYELCLERIMLRDGVDESLARKKIDAQMNIEEKLKYADVVLNNRKDKNALFEEIQRAIFQLLQIIELHK